MQNWVFINLNNFHNLGGRPSIPGAFPCFSWQTERSTSSLVRSLVSIVSEEVEFLTNKQSQIHEIITFMLWSDRPLQWIGHYVISCLIIFSLNMFLINDTVFVVLNERNRLLYCNFMVSFLGWLNIRCCCTNRTLREDTTGSAV